jgi:lysophospholipase L1-like esterase
MQQRASENPEPVPMSRELPRGLKRQRPRKLKQKLLLLVCATLTGLFAAEIGLRLAEISFPELYTPDPHCASRLRPGASGWWTSEGHAWVSINADGLRDREHRLTKLPGVVRIAVLGDSFTEALQVDARDAWWAVAERELRRTGDFGDRQLEFINFGVSGYGTAQELLMLRNYVWKYEPDVVIVAFCHNDIQDNSRELGGGETRPYFEVRNDALQLDNSFRESDGYLTAQSWYEQTKARLVNTSYVLQVLKHARHSWQMRHDGPTVSDRGFADIGTTFNVYAPPVEDSENRAWDVTERIIVDLHSAVLAGNARFGLLTVTAPLQVHPDSEVRRNALQHESVQDLLYTETRLSALAEQYKFPILTLAIPLREYAETQDVFLHGFPNTKLGTGHWNKRGHHVAGQHVAKWLANDLAD